jgi:hypothetical protein
VFFLGAIGESFFQKNQVAAEFELSENREAAIRRSTAGTAEDSIAI